MERRAYSLRMKEFIRYCVELLEALGPVRVKPMFGAHGLYVDEIFMALIGSDEQLYLKVDEQSRPRFEAAGCEPFRFVEKSGEVMTMSYYKPPEEAMESPALMRPWARLAMEAALRKRNAKPARKPAAKKASKPA